MTRKPTEIRQEEIKKAVLEIIRKEGIRAISTKNLAMYTSISEGAIFRHFKSKRDIIISIINDVSNDLIGTLRNISLEKTGPRDRLLKYMCNTINYLSDNNGITILLFSEASQSNDDEMKKKLNHIFNSQREYVGNIIADGISEGIWDKSISVKDVTLLYMGIPITHNINIILSGDKVKIKNYCKHMMVLIERMLSPNTTI